MTVRPTCVTCGTGDRLKPVSERFGTGWGCPAHFEALRGRLGDPVDALTWYQATREQRLRDRTL